MGSESSNDAIRSISNWGASAPPRPVSLKKATEEFGSLTFNEEVQRSLLPKDV